MVRYYDCRLQVAGSSVYCEYLIALELAGEEYAMKKKIYISAYGQGDTDWGIAGLEADTGTRLRNNMKGDRRIEFPGASSEGPDEDRCLIKLS